MAKKPFEKSGADKEPRGMKEGSKAEKAMDKKQMPAFMKKTSAKGKK